MNIGYSMNYCSKLLKNKLNKELEIEDITVAQFAVIKDIEIYSGKGELEEGITAAEIADRLDMDKPTISGIVNRLIDKGYIDKFPHPKDGRAYILKLTKSSIEKLPNLEAINNKVILEAVKGLGEDDLYILYGTLNKIIQNLK